MDLKELREKLPPSFESVICNSCQERGEGKCILRITFRNRIIFNGDELIPKKRSCDCIILAEIEEENKNSNNSRFYICLVELKSRSIKGSVIEEKFNSTIKKISEDCPFLNNSQIEPKFILLSKKIHPLDRERIKHFRPSLFGKERALKRGKCGDSLEIFI